MIKLHLNFFTSLPSHRKGRGFNSKIFFQSSTKALFFIVRLFFYYSKKGNLVGKAAVLERPLLVYVNVNVGACELFYPV